MMARCCQSIYMYIKFFCGLALAVMEKIFPCLLINPKDSKSFIFHPSIWSSSPPVLCFPAFFFCRKLLKQTDVQIDGRTKTHIYDTQLCHLSTRFCVGFYGFYKHNFYSTAAFAYNNSNATKEFILQIASTFVYFLHLLNHHQQHTMVTASRTHYHKAIRSPSVFSPDIPHLSR